MAAGVRKQSPWAVALSLASLPLRHLSGNDARRREADYAGSVVAVGCRPEERRLPTAVWRYAKRSLASRLFDSGERESLIAEFPGGAPEGRSLSRLSPRL
jgi:hypothetical protein